LTSDVDTCLQVKRDESKKTMVLVPLAAKLDDIYRELRDIEQDINFIMNHLEI
jgi:hypothetical protein